MIISRGEKDEEKLGSFKCSFFAPQNVPWFLERERANANSGMCSTAAEKGWGQNNLQAVHVQRSWGLCLRAQRNVKAAEGCLQSRQEFLLQDEVWSVKMGSLCPLSLVRLSLRHWAEFWQRGGLPAGRHSELTAPASSSLCPISGLVPWL